jgi:hypothetical protein
MNFERIGPRVTMRSGMFIFCFGILLLGSIPIWYVMIIGILIFSVGEFVTHPNFISYVSKIAPKDKVALYMGYAFIPSAIGNVTGSTFGGIMWDNIAVAREQPALFWALYVGIGLITIGNFLLYNRWITKKKGILDDRRSFWNSRATYAGIYSIVIAIVIIGASLGTTAYVGGYDNEKDDMDMVYMDQSTTVATSGQLVEGSMAMFEVEVEELNLIFFNATLTWDDENEPPGRPRIRQYENQPEEFKIEILMENLTQDYSVQDVNVVGSQGNIPISIPLNGTLDYADYTGTYTISVTLVNSGNYIPNIGVLALNDPGNSFDLLVEYTYLKEIEPI